MVWTKVGDDHFDRLEVMQLTRSARLLGLEATVFSNRMLLDGDVPRAALRRITDSDDVEADAAELVAAGLWEPKGDGWSIVDFLKDQPSRAHVEAIRAARAKAGTKGGQRSGESRRTKAEATAQATPKQIGSRSVEPRPVPRRTGRAAPVLRCPNNFPYSADGDCCGQPHQQAASA
jgi:hypothetical protein